MPLPCFELSPDCYLRIDFTTVPLSAVLLLSVTKCTDEHDLCWRIVGDGGVNSAKYRGTFHLASAQRVIVLPSPLELEWIV